MRGALAAAVGVLAGTAALTGTSPVQAKDIVLKATGDVKIEGINVKAKGNAGAEVQSSGTTVIKGAIVNIN